MSATYQYQAGGTTVTGVNRPLSALVGAPAGVIEGSLSRDAAGRVRTAHWQRRGTIRGTEVYGSVTYQYDAAGRRRQATDFANVSWHYGYNNRGEVTGAEKRAASGTVLGGWGQGYSYDDIGNRRQVVTPEGETLDLTANALNQISTRQTEQKSWLRGRAHPLASVEVDGNAVTREGRNWKFLLNAAGSGSELRIQEYMVLAARADLVPEVGDEINETVTFRPSSVSLTHDDDGNLTFDGRWHYEWDAENRLVAMEEAASHSISGTGVSSGFARANRLEFAYDALGRRVRKRVLDAPRDAQGVRSGAWVLKKETVFVWQDWRMLAEYVKTPEITMLQLRRSYLWGMDLVSGVYQAGMAENAAALSPAGGVGGLLWVVDYLPGQSTSNRQLAPWYDGNGNILGWVENELAQVQPLHRLEYDAFGRLLVDDPVRVALTKKQSDLGATEAWLDRPAFGFSTKYEDGETGLLYFGYRYYAPEVGRWVSRDPIEEAGGANLYGMLNNDPVNSADKLGLLVYQDYVEGRYTSLLSRKLGFWAKEFRPAFDSSPLATALFTFYTTRNALQLGSASGSDIYWIGNSRWIRPIQKHVDKTAISKFFETAVAKYARMTSNIALRGESIKYRVGKDVPWLSPIWERLALQGAAIGIDMTCEQEDLACGGSCSATISLYDRYDFTPNHWMQEPLYFLAEFLPSEVLGIAVPFNVAAQWKAKYEFDPGFKILENKTVHENVK